MGKTMRSAAVIVAACAIASCVGTATATATTGQPNTPAAQSTTGTDPDGAEWG